MISPVEVVTDVVVVVVAEVVVVVVAEVVVVVVAEVVVVVVTRENVEHMSTAIQAIDQPFRH